MKGFIEVTQKNTKTKFLISVSQIKYIEKSDDGTEIAIDCTGTRKGWCGRIIVVEENYEEIKSKVLQAQ